MPAGMLFFQSAAQNSRKSHSSGHFDWHTIVSGCENACTHWGSYLQTNAAVWPR